MIRFLLNQQPIQTDLPAGQTLLDFIRYQQHLKGTKIGCREGDCGACTVLLGSHENGEVKYQSVTSCLVPLGNAEGKHVVTIEGLNVADLSPVQQAIVQENGTQCGFCTVGFVVSLTGHCLQTEATDQAGTVAAMDGNICRCTGYKSLERAAVTITESLKDRPVTEHISWLADKQFIPAYFKEVPARLAKLNENAIVTSGAETDVVFALGGGTDLLVQKPETVRDSKVKLLGHDAELKGISVKENRVFIGGGTTVSELRNSVIMQEAFPQLYAHIKLISSTQIRNMGTVGGNFANASPIGDLTIYFLALNATVFLQKTSGQREIPLKDFYLGYKTLAKEPEEIISQIAFEIPPANAFFNFEKVSKRMHLDIASVNAALQIRMENNRITEAFASAGGIGPIPFSLAKTAAFLTGKEINPETIKAAAEIIQTEINPISDARGTAQYKRLLLRQLFYAHFLKFFPAQLKSEDLL